MKRAAIFSAVLHLVFLCLVFFGVPFLKTHKDLSPPTPIPVELLPIAEETQAPKPSPVPAKEEKTDASKKPETKPQPVPTPIEPEPAPEPKPEPKADPKPQPKAEPEPDPVDETEVMPQLKPKEKPVQKPEPKPQQKPPKPAIKPKPPKKETDKKTVKTFDSVLKNIAKLKTDSDTQEDANKDAQGSSSAQVGKVGPTFTMSEIDALKQQIAGCWSVNPGARDIEKFIITLELQINPDRTVREARIVPRSEFAGNPFYQSFAESALRAVRDQRCSPLRLPPEKYEQWKEMTLNFRLSDLIR